MTYKQRLKELLSELRKQRLDGDGKKSRDLLTAIYKEMTGPGQPDLDTATCFLLAGLLMYGDIGLGDGKWTGDYTGKAQAHFDLCKAMFALIADDASNAIDPAHVSKLLLERNK